MIFAICHGFDCQLCNYCGLIKNRLKLKGRSCNVKFLIYEISQSLKRERESEEKKEAMDEQEFRSRLQLYPVVRSRDYRADLDSSSSKQSTSLSVVEREEVSEWHDAPSVVEPEDLKDRKTNQDTFWDQLKAAAEKKVGEVEAERFCKAFEKLHKKLVYEELNPEAAKRYLLNS
ncbi:unnamed protein product [Brassica napus]|uniref:(rape) hypothetical protein n=2 Tax=Brassica napus TaxID=3708 RepID=A0A816I5J1_BRANA|nr:unnamed protein product [Brassica napus]